MASFLGATRATRAACPVLRCHFAPLPSPACLSRWVSSQAAEAVADLESDSSLRAPIPDENSDARKRYRPKVRTGRQNYLPGTRYQYHPPKYNRGPLHPVQSPATSDPIARDFVPGPFNLPRLRQTYQSTIAPDLMTLAYMHKPPGTVGRKYEDRLRSWDASSPYHMNRPLREPRGSPTLRLVERDIDFGNIPEIKSITLSSYVPKTLKNDDNLIVARAIVQSITGVWPEITKTHANVQQWGIAKGKDAGVKATLYGNAAYEFIDKCIHLVFPKIKDWPGVRGTSGDRSGNISWGFNPDDMQLFPEVDANVGMYPAKMIPGARVNVNTTAQSDRQAKLLMQALGIPFYVDRSR